MNTSAFGSVVLALMILLLPRSAGCADRGARVDDSASRRTSNGGHLVQEVVAAMKRPVKDRYARLEALTTVDEMILVDLFKAHHMTGELMPVGIVALRVGDAALWAVGRIGSRESSQFLQKALRHSIQELQQSLAAGRGPVPHVATIEYIASALFRCEKDPEKLSETMEDALRVFQNLDISSASMNVMARRSHALKLDQAALISWLRDDDPLRVCVALRELAERGVNLGAYADELLQQADQAVFWKRELIIDAEETTIIGILHKTTTVHTEAARHKQEE